MKRRMKRLVVRKRGLSILLHTKRLREHFCGKKASSWESFTFGLGDSDFANDDKL